MASNANQSGTFQVPPPPPGPMSKEMIEKTQRSVFVGNIPYEATEEALVEVFSKAGPVVGFRLVYDRESGKPKGYGFCEYKDYTSAQTALRHLQNIEYNGRPLRIGPAAGELNSAEIALNNPNVGPPVESMYGERCEPRDAPEAISRAVASLPPEQMYELMKQMKLCIQNNPNEARNMLLQNPQLAYALLQAQIVMKIVDPKVAIAMLNRRNEQVPPAMMEQQLQQPQQAPPPRMPPPGPSMPPPMAGMPMNMGIPPPRGPMGPPPVSIPMSNPLPVPSQPHSSAPMMRPPGPVPAPVGGPPMRPLDQGPGPVAPPGPPVSAGHFAVPPAPGRPAIPVSMPPMAGGLSGLLQSGSLLAGRPDEEKAALIMQVLQLSDDQIAMLPEDQRKSIMILKEQVNRGR